MLGIPLVAFDTDFTIIQSHLLNDLLLKGSSSQGIVRAALRWYSNLMYVLEVHIETFRSCHTFRKKPQVGDRPQL
jgi:hypothetical protein